MTYKLHERLVAPARDKSDILRLIFGLLTITFLYITMFMLGGHVVSVIMGDAWAQAVVTSPGLTSPGQMLTILGSFGFMIIAVCSVVVLLHHRSPMTLLGGFRLPTAQFFQAMRNLLPYMALLVTFAFVTEDLQPNLTLELWLSLLPFTLLFLLVQVSAEELVFRGYLQSQLAALGLHKSIWVLLPAVLFGLLHYDPIIMGSAAPWIVLWAICFGVLAADLTARSGTLGPAVAFHFTVNFLSIGVIGISDYLGGLNLYSYPFSITDTANLITYLPLDTIGMLLAYLSVRLALRR
tara:strand:+ start:1021 stop:1902 length:882 start_codon:yes stop_codon:yes gene_type:complete